MRDPEDLFGALSELIYLAFYAHFLNRVFDFLDIDHAFVGEGVEQVEGFDGLLAALFAAEYQVDPFMQVFRDVI